MHVYSLPPGISALYTALLIPLLSLGTCFVKVQNSGIWSYSVVYVKPFLASPCICFPLNHIGDLQCDFRPLRNILISCHVTPSQTSSETPPPPRLFFLYVTALPTSPSRCERLSFPLVKRWDLVCLLELMTKRSTGLPSRWMDGSQLSLKPLSADVCFPFGDRRGFSAAKQITSGSIESV